MINTILYQCLVLDDNDPMMLGRVRGTLLIDNYQDIIKSFDDPPWNEERDAWTDRDPFIFVPLMPYYVYQTPKPGEMVQAMYMVLQDSPHQYQNQYYVQSNFFSPTSSSYQYFEGSNKFTGTGFQIQVPKPLKNKDGSFTERGVHAGVFPQPGDNALLGRGSADVIVKQDEVLIRAGKFTNSMLEPNVIPTANKQRGFLQLSRFGSSLVNQPPKFYKKVKPTNLLVNYLIEYVIINPENKIINPDGTVENKFTGAVYLYQLKPDPSITSGNLKAGTKVAGNLKRLVDSASFVALSKEDTINFINTYIKNCNDKNINLRGKVIFSEENPTGKFPIFYRPNFFLWSYIDPSLSKGKNSDGIASASEIYKNIKLNPAINVNGNGLIWKKDTVGTPIEIKKEKVNQVVYDGKPTTFGGLASDTFYLLSYLTQPPNGKRPIIYDDTLYGFTTEKVTRELLPNTSSMVRGEELLELLNVIVKFLISHTHAYPGMPPVPITQEGTSTSDILTQMQEAYTNILNANLRIN